MRRSQSKRQGDGRRTQIEAGNERTCVRDRGAHFSLPEPREQCPTGSRTHATPNLRLTDTHAAPSSRLQVQG
jgi:hypothetical protein